jgi:flagellar biosynthetic protein FliQ
MTVDLAVELGQSAVFLVLILCGPPLIAALVVGLVVGLLQAVTQLQEPTIGFVPRLIIVMAVLACLWPWMCERLVDYSTSLYHGVPGSL